MSTSENIESASSSVMCSQGQLANKLHSALDITREKFVSSIKFSLMKKFYRPIYDDNPKALKYIHDQLCSQLMKTLSEELDEICKEHSIDFLLNSLEEIKKNQNPSQPSWRPSGNPEEDLRDHIYPIKVKHKESLQCYLNKLEVSNEELFHDVVEKHGKIMSIEKSIEDLHKEFNEITTSLAGTNLENLERILTDSLESME